jgi:hypothetical protein
MEPELARRIALEESGDVKARWLLIDLAEAAYNARELVAASLVHAAAYLENRAQYASEPWPKGMIRVPFSDLQAEEDASL